LKLKPPVPVWLAETGTVRFNDAPPVMVWFERLPLPTIELPLKAVTLTFQLPGVTELNVALVPLVTVVL
jgi:hypothetical protein